MQSVDAIIYQRMHQLHAVALVQHWRPHTDLMQALLLSLWKALPAYRSDSRVSTIVHRVTHNAALTWHRDRRRRQIETHPEPESVPESIEGSCHRRDEWVLDLLSQCIQELSPVDRSPMLLSLDNLSYEEIGFIHGLSSNLVGVSHHRLRKQLLTDMKENLDDLMTDCFPHGQIPATGRHLPRWRR